MNLVLDQIWNVEQWRVFVIKKKLYYHTMITILGEIMVIIFFVIYLLYSNKVNKVSWNSISISLISISIFATLFSFFYNKYAISFFITQSIIIIILGIIAALLTDTIITAENISNFGIIQYHNYVFAIYIFTLVFTIIFNLFNRNHIIEKWKQFDKIDFDNRKFDLERTTYSKDEQKSILKSATWLPVIVIVCSRFINMILGTDVSFLF